MVNDYFIIAFDDADMNSQYGWEILELIRKYLNSPKIITIIAGDLELYTSIVKYNLRKQQNDNIEDQKLEVSAEEYILKLFPFKNRIKLSGLQSLSTNPDVNEKIWLDFGERHPHISLGKAFKKLTGYYINSENEDCQRIHGDIIFDCSTRRLIEILKDEKDKLINTNKTRTIKLSPYIESFCIDALKSTYEELNITYIERLVRSQDEDNSIGVFNLVLSFFNGLLNQNQSNYSVLQQCLTLIPSESSKEFADNIKKSMTVFSILVARECSRKPHISIRYFRYCLVSSYLMVLFPQINTLIKIEYDNGDEASFVEANVIRNEHYNKINTDTQKDLKQHYSHEFIPHIKKIIEDNFMDSLTPDHDVPKTFDRLIDHIEKYRENIIPKQIFYHDLFLAQDSYENSSASQESAADDNKSPRFVSPCVEIVIINGNFRIEFNDCLKKLKQLLCLLYNIKINNKENNYAENDANLPSAFTLGEACIKMFENLLELKPDINIINDSFLSAISFAENKNGDLNLLNGQTILPRDLVKDNPDKFPLTKITLEEIDKPNNH